MELPLGGPALRHYTQSRPRPHRQKLNYRPSRPQETIIESENEALEFMGRVDEGVEEFFTKRVLPTDTLKQQDEESITVHEVAPASSAPCPPPTKTLRRKLGDFFTLKKRRGLKSETSHEGRPKKASIADLIRPLREVARSEKEKDKDRVKEHDKENEKEKAKEQIAAVTGESGIKETPVSGAPPLRGDAAPPRRALREGKSQSLILLSGSAAAGTANARNTAKKQFEGQHSFEQKLHLMLQRIGVSKPQQGETQSPEGEMKKAESEGTIIDSKPEPPPTFSKPRTMSASSDTRHQIRASVSAHEAAGKPALLPKPVIKPGPPPTTSGRNTPENELAQIEEAEKNTPTKPSPASTPSTPSVTAIATSPVPTISNSIPDPTDSPGSASSTVTPPNKDLCTESVNPTTAAISPTKGTVVDSKASTPETSVCSTDLPTTTVTTTLTSTTTLTEPLSAVSVTSTSSEAVTLVTLATLATPATSTSPTTTGPSITTSETASAPSSECSVTIASTNLPIKSDTPEPKGILPADATAAGDATIPVTTAASSLCTSTSDTPSSLSAPLNLISESSDESTSVTSVLLITETTSSPYSSHITTTTVPPDTPVTTSCTTVSATPTSTTSTSLCIPDTISPIPSDCRNAVLTSNIPLSSSGPSDISVPSTSSSETNPTDTPSTATSLNRADTTSTSSSATTMAVGTAITTDSDPPLSNNVSTTLTSTNTSLTAADNSSATSPHVTAPALSNDSSCQDDGLSSEERSERQTAEKDPADGELHMIHKTKLMETCEKQEACDSEKKTDTNNEKQTQVNIDATRREAQEESVEPEDTVSKPASGKRDEQSKDEGVTESGKQEETQPVSDK
ncbi:unnamed protein product [Ophioblennius macclurei]